MTRRKPKLACKTFAMAYFSARGYVVQDAERRLPIPGRYVTKDFGDFADVIAWGGPLRCIIAIQATSHTHAAGHLTALLANPKVKAWVESRGRVLLMTWGGEGIGAARTLTRHIWDVILRDGLLAPVRGE